MRALQKNDRAFAKARAAIESGEMNVSKALEKFDLTSPAYYTRLRKEKGPKKKRGAKSLKEASGRVTMTEIQGANMTAGKTLIIFTNDPATVEKTILGFMRGDT